VIDSRGSESTGWIIPGIPGTSIISFVKGKTEISPDLPDILLASDIYQNITLQDVRYVVLFKKNMRGNMPTLSATEARTKLYRLIDETSLTHEPIVITGKRGNAVLISEDDWRAIQETMFLLNIPGMQESIKEGLATPIEECNEEIEW